MNTLDVCERDAGSRTAWKGLDPFERCIFNDCNILLIFRGYIIRTCILF